MDIKEKQAVWLKEKQAVWLKEKPLFEAEFIHSHLLPFFNFNENAGDYEIKSQSVNNTDDEDRKVAYESLNTGWAMWLRAKCDAKAQAVPSVVVGFDEWFRKRHEKTGLYEEALCGKDDATYIRHEMRKSFLAGLKENQVIPEGFVLVPKEPNDKIVYDVLDSIFSCSFCYDDPASWERAYKKLIKGVQKAMIEAQEQSHD